MAAMTPKLGVTAGFALALVAWTAPSHAEGPDACLSSYESAQRLRLETKLRAAKAALVTCARAECPDVLRRDCSRWLGEVEKSLPSVVVAARRGATDVTEVRVVIDGDIVAESLDGSAITLDPGKHAFRFELDGAPAVERSLLIVAGEKDRAIEVSFEAPADAKQTAAPSALPVYALGALGVVALGSFAYFGLSSHAKREDLAACKGHCPEDDVDEVRREQLVADVSLGVGLVALGAAAYLHFGRAGGPPKQEARWHLGIAGTGRGATAALGTRF